MYRLTYRIIAVLVCACCCQQAPAVTIGHWRFEEGTPGNAAGGADSVLDSSASLHHGTPNGGPVYSNATPFGTVPQTGQANNLSLSFDGANDTVAIPHTTSLDSAGPFTVEFWMRSSGTGFGQDLLVDKSHGFTDSTGWVFQSNPNADFIFFAVGLGGESSTNFRGVQTLSDLFDNQWHHLAGTYDGTTTEFFVDGVSQGTNTVGTYVGNTRDVRIGNTWQFSRFFAGQIDELRISDTVLSTCELLNAAVERSCAVTFSTNFESGVPPEFSGVTTTEPVQGFSNHGYSGDFLRNLTSQPPLKTTLSLTNLPPHDFISIGFLLAIIDTWDGPVSGAMGGEDKFNVALDGNVVFSQHFQNAYGGDQNYAAPPGVLLVEKTQLGFRQANEQDSESGFSMGNDPAFQEIAHTSSTAVIEWFASGAGWDHNNDGGAQDESWAIDDVFVSFWSAGELPAIQLSRADPDTLSISFKGVIQTSDDLINWDDVTPQPFCPWPFNTADAQKFFRARDYAD